MLGKHCINILISLLAVELSLPLHTSFLFVELAFIGLSFLKPKQNSNLSSLFLSKWCS